MKKKLLLGMLPILLLSSCSGGNTSKQPTDEEILNLVISKGITTHSNYRIRTERPLKVINITSSDHKLYFSVMDTKQSVYSITFTPNVVGSLNSYWAENSLSYRNMAMLETCVYENIEYQELIAITYDFQFYGQSTYTQDCCYAWVTTEEEVAKLVL